MNKCVVLRIVIMMYNMPVINYLQNLNCGVHNYTTRQTYLLQVTKCAYSTRSGNIGALLWNAVQFKIKVNFFYLNSNYLLNCLCRNIHLKCNNNKIYNIIYNALLYYPILFPHFYFAL